jgi:signal transduction histidine kinase
MTDMSASSTMPDPVVRPLLGRQAPAAPRRMPLRATGLLAILGVMTLALLLVASALLFRGAVQSHLEGLEQAHARQSMLMQRQLDEARGDRDPERLHELEQQQRASEANGARHLAEANHYIDAGTIAIACLAWLGITTIGALAMLFFSRLAVDIGAVRARALAIVVGDRRRGQPLARNDELNDLAHALDSLAEALARHERDLEIERRHVMHQEKLAAIGSMAAGVLREIGNPIAAIDGYARALVEAQQNGQDAPAPDAWCDPGQILRETARLVAITRDISELAAAPAPESQLASLNEIVTQSLALLRYEPRLEGVTVAAALDPQLPAVVAIADRLVLLVTNLVINAADATAGLPPRTGWIELATRCAGAGVELRVSDNGCGMSEAVRERAFEPLFTTKLAGRGTGLGLPLCRSIADEHGGQITLESNAGQGTLVRVWLPLST